MRISDWSSDVCSSDLRGQRVDQQYQSHQLRELLPGRLAGEFQGAEKYGAADREHAPRRQSKRPGQYALEHPDGHGEQDLKGVVEVKSVSVSVDLGGRRLVRKNIYGHIIIIKNK